ncbi:hypothetical protein [Cellulomonas marina]|uniref:Uncharacterized protein n=1 Tax=Cellulomonas marina TaxID=988821 RepID=A0A1I0Y233_9CELL|nr:hypothetical protein [Cellulomonas marina]GIG28392.1 hypothetical protein Cma02nite_09920 [Cellulomonas marina]SFB07272.1 hypothetical protein SAMN05421867_106129 [Cellulomonas marina]
MRTPWGRRAVVVLAWFAGAALVLLAVRGINAVRGLPGTEAWTTGLPGAGGAFIGVVVGRWSMSRRARREAARGRLVLPVRSADDVDGVPRQWSGRQVQLGAGSVELSALRHRLHAGPFVVTAARSTGRTTGWGWATEPGRVVELLTAAGAIELAVPHDRVDRVLEMVAPHPAVDGPAGG